MNPHPVSEEEYSEACDELAGFCKNCKEFVNHGSCEPDACNYTCDNCELPQVFGAEEALIMGLITFE